MPVTTVKTVEELERCDKLILPGVGAFDHAMKRLHASGLYCPLTRKVLQEKVPVLGICVGMQMLADSSEEGILPGLGWIPGTVRKFDTAQILHKPKLPHMGWNLITPEASPIFKGITPDSRFYFIHSYYFSPVDPAHIVARSRYGDSFAAAVGRDNIFGVQFHPEKSHHNGITVLENFARL